ncbi:MAG: glycerate kinase, partial [Candidatus Limisoma sp.]
MKVVIAPDKFKGSLTSVEVADAIEQGILSVNLKCQTRKLYIADGGDGTMEAIVNSLNGSTVVANVSNPVGRTIEARYGIVNSDTAVIDVATASGVALLSGEERNPLYTTSFGTGELILHAIKKKGIKKFIIGIGGSATNDAATGLLSALGFVFRDSSGNPLTGCGANLEKIQSIDESNVNESIRECTFTILCDVDA